MPQTSLATVSRTAPPGLARGAGNGAAPAAAQAPGMTTAWTVSFVNGAVTESPPIVTAMADPISEYHGQAIFWPSGNGIQHFDPSQSAQHEDRRAA